MKRRLLVRVAGLICAWTHCLSAEVDITEAADRPKMSTQGASESLATAAGGLLIDPDMDCVPAQAEDRCEFVRSVHECFEGDPMVDYLEVLYCSTTPMVVKILLGILWMGILFYMLGMVADLFLCPALQLLSNRLMLPPDIAGITLLAFANGAPDIFTEIAAITSGKKVDMGLALSVTLGSGMCICVAVYSVIIIMKPVQVKPGVRAAYIRDTTAYLLTCVLMIIFMYDGRFTFVEAALMLGTYLVYICVAVLSYALRLEAGQIMSDSAGIPLVVRSPAREEGSVTDHPATGAEADAPVGWLEELFSWSHLGEWQRKAAPVVLPIQLLLHVTMPIVTDGVISEGYAVVMCFAAPLFALGALGMTSVSIGNSNAILLWLGISMLFLVYLHMFAKRGASGLPSRSSWFLAFIAFGQSILWMNVLADELVAYFHALGRSMGVTQELIGGTVLAWGECTADLVASMAIARSGNADMAISACFGCPVMNLLGGMGVGLFYQTLRTGPVLTNLNNGVFMLGGASVLCLLYQTLGVPYFHGWTLSRNLAIGLLAFYVFTQVAFFISESSIVQEVVVANISQ